MKKSKLTRSLLALLFALVLVLASALPAGARPAEDKEPKREAISWTLSEDMKTLTAEMGGEETVYTFLGSEEDYFGADFDPKEGMWCKNKVKSPSGLTYAVTTAGDGAFAYFNMAGGKQIYATAAAGASVGDLFAEDAPDAFALRQGNYGALLEEETARALMAFEAGGREISARELAGSLVFTLTGTDAAYAFHREWCLIFELEDGYFALQVPTLDNTHFDANGKFSYRSGTVTVHPVGDDLTRKLDSAELSYWREWVDEEELLVEDSLKETDPKGPFISATVILLLLPALIFTVIHTVKLCRASGEMRRRRAILTASVGAWLVLSIAVVIVVACL